MKQEPDDVFTFYRTALLNTQGYREESLRNNDSWKITVLTGDTLLLV